MTGQTRYAMIDILGSVVSDIRLSLCLAVVSVQQRLHSYDAALRSSDDMREEFAALQPPSDDSEEEIFRGQQMQLLRKWDEQITAMARKLQMNGPNASASKRPSIASTAAAASSAMSPAAATANQPVPRNAAKNRTSSSAVAICAAAPPPLLAVSTAATLSAAAAAPPDFLLELQQARSFHDKVAQLYEGNRQLRAKLAGAEAQLASKEAAYAALLQTHASEVAAHDQRTVTVKREKFDAQADAQGAHQTAEKVRVQKRKADAALGEEAKRHKITAEQLRSENARVAELLEARLCSICSDRPACAVNLPCGHLAGCMQCAERWRQSDGTCPSCRGDIEAVQRVFLP